MASVYRAQHADGSLHALKVLRRTDDVRLQREMLRRFVAEGEIQAQLSHPHILPVNGILEDPAGTALVMELLEGEDLAGRLRRKGALPPLQAVVFTQQILSALSLVHASGVIHRDLKPGNVFLERQEDGPPRVRVLDFGLARVIGLTQTKTGVIIGSLCYLSPEQIQDSKAVDHRSDLFSVGALLYEMLTGMQAFVAESEFAVMERIREGRYLPIRSINPDIPDGLVAVVSRALQAEADHRYPDARRFFDDLKTLRDADAVPRTVSTRINNAQETLLRKKVRSTLEKSLARMSRRRGGLGGLPELPALQQLFTLAGRLEAMPLPALVQLDEGLQEYLVRARQALQDWEEATAARIEALKAARITLRRVRAENQAPQIESEVSGGLGRRRRWSDLADARHDAEVLAIEAVEAALEALPAVPPIHPLATLIAEHRQRVSVELTHDAQHHPPPPVPMWVAVAVGVVVGLLGAGVIAALS